MGLSKSFLALAAFATFLIFLNITFNSNVDSALRLERSQASRVRHDRFIRKFSVNAGPGGDVVASHFRHNTLKKKEPICGVNLMKLSENPLKNADCVNCISHSYANKESFLCKDLLPVCKSINRSEKHLLKCIACAGGSHDVCSSLMSEEHSLEAKPSSDILKSFDKDGSIAKVVTEIKTRFDDV